MNTVVRVLTEYECTASLPLRTLAPFDALVADLVSASGGSDQDALKRVASTLRVARPLFHWDRKSHATAWRGYGGSSASNWASAAARND